MSVFKQLAIKSLVNSEDLQQEIMSFAFMDQKEHDARVNKNKMIRDMNRNLKYSRGPGGYWILSYKEYRSDSKTIGGQACGQCGKYYTSHNEHELTNCVKCNCHVEEVDFEF